MWAWMSEDGLRRGMRRGYLYCCRLFILETSIPFRHGSHGGSAFARLPLASTDRLPLPPPSGAYPRASRSRMATDGRSYVQSKRRVVHKAMPCSYRIPIQVVDTFLGSPFERTAARKPQYFHRSLTYSRTVASCRGRAHITPRTHCPRPRPRRSATDEALPATHLRFQCLYHCFEFFDLVA